MTNQTYREETKRTLPNLSFRENDSKELVRVYDDEVGNKLNLCHMALGLGGELGELTNCTGTELKIKIDKINLGEELGDIYWYITNYCNLRNMPIPEIMVVSIPNDMCLDLLLRSVGGLIDIVKRYIAYNQEINKAKEAQIIYDIYSAIYLFETIYELDGGAIRDKNIAKLRVRYPKKFEDNLALNRNTEEEKKVL